MRMGEFGRTRWDLEDMSKLEKRELLLRQIERDVPDVLRTLETLVYTPFRHLLPIDPISYEQAFLEAWDKETGYQQAKQIELALASKDEARADSLLRIRKAAAKRHWNSGHDDTVTTWYGLNKVGKWCPEYEPFREAILNWSNDWQLNADWCCDHALKTVNQWADDWTDIGEWAGIVGDGGFVCIDADEERRLLPDGWPLQWEPFRTTQVSYLNDVEKSLREEIDSQPLWAALAAGFSRAALEVIIKKFVESLRVDYCKKLATYYEQHGYKRFRKRTAIQKHIAWTVRLRLLCRPPDSIRKTILSIAANERVGRKDPGEYGANAVIKAVRLMLDDLGLPVTPTFRTSPGRPKGSRDDPMTPRQTIGVAK